MANSHTSPSNREQALADALQLVLDDWANGNIILEDAMDKAHAALSMRSEKRRAEPVPCYGGFWEPTPGPLPAEARCSVCHAPADQHRDIEAATDSPRQSGGNGRSVGGSPAPQAGDSYGDKHGEAYDRARDIVRYADTKEGAIPACYSWVAVMLARALLAHSATSAITAKQIHEVYQEEFYRKDKTGKQLAHPTHADLIKAVIHRLLGVEITEPWNHETDSGAKS